MSDTCDSEGSSSSCSWSMVDNHGNLIQDDDSESTSSSVEVVEDNSDHDNDGATPLAGNSPYGTSHPVYVLRLPSREQEGSDTDDNQCVNPTTPSTSVTPSSPAIQMSQTSAMSQTPTKGSLSSVTSSDTQFDISPLISLTNSPTPEPSLTQVAQHGGIQEVSSVEDLLMSQEAPVMSQTPELSPSSSKQHIPQEHIDRLVRAIDDVQHQVRATDNDQSGQSSMSSVAVVGEGNSDIGIQETVPPTELASTTHLDTTNPPGDTPTVEPANLPDDTIRDRFNYAFRNQGVHNPNNRSQCRSMLDQLQTIYFFCILAVWVLVVLAILNYGIFRPKGVCHLEAESQFMELKTELAHTKENEKRLKQILNDCIEYTDNARLKYSNYPQLDGTREKALLSEITDYKQTVTDLESDLELSYTTRMKLDHNLQKCENAKINRVQFQENKYDELTATSSGLEELLKKRKVEVEAKRMEVKRHEDLLLELDKDINLKGEDYNVKRGKLTVLERKRQYLDNMYNDMKKTNDEMESGEQTTADEGCGKTVHELNYLSCWKMLEKMVKEKYVQVTDTDWNWSDIQQMISESNVGDFWKTVTSRNEDKTEDPSDKTEKTDTDHYTEKTEQNTHQCEFQSDHSNKDQKSTKQSAKLHKSGKNQSKQDSENQSEKYAESQSKQTDPLPRTWTDSMLEMMNKTKGQIQDTWEQVKNMSDNLWLENEPALTKLHNTFSRKLQHLTDKFHKKFSRKIKKWYQKQEGKEHSKQSTREARQQNKATGKAAGTMRRKHKEREDQMPQNSEKQHRVNTPTCHEDVVQMDKLIMTTKRDRGVGGFLEDDGETTLAMEILRHLTTLKHDHELDISDRQRRWITCQYKWWKTVGVSPKKKTWLDVGHPLIGHGCLQYLRCWQVKLSRGDLDRYQQIRQDKGNDNDCFGHLPEKLYCNPECADDCTLSADYAADKVDSLHHLYNYAANDVDDDDKTQKNWYIERAEDREYHHDEPDDWFFRRKQEQEVKISKRQNDVDNQVFGSQRSQNGESHDAYQGHEEDYEYFDEEDYSCIEL